MSLIYTPSQLPDLCVRSSASPYSSSGAESLMLEMQVLIAKDFDEQMRKAGDQIKFLNNIKSIYRERMNKLQEFMAKNQNSSRKDGKKYVEASFSQMAELCNNMQVVDFNLDTMECKDEGMTLQNNGDKQTIDEADENGKVWVPVENGKVETSDLATYFAEGSKITDPANAQEFAKKLGGDKNNLPFYFGHKNNKDDHGMPKFAVFVDQIDKIMSQMQNKLTDIEEKGELLSTTLNQLSNQRKAALDGANQLLSKMEQIRSNTVSKMQ